MPSTFSSPGGSLQKVELALCQFLHSSPLKKIIIMLHCDDDDDNNNDDDDNDDDATSLLSGGAAACRVGSVPR